MEIPFEGGCACGAVRYRCSAEPLAIYNCHCPDCRSASGAASAPLLVMPAEAVRASGPVRHYQRVSERDSHGTRAFCSECGSPMFASGEALPDILLVRAGTLDDPNDCRPVAEIWTATALPWAHMDPHLPKVFRSPPLLGGNGL